MVFDAQFRHDPGANCARRPRQGLGDPSDQRGLLPVVPAAVAAFIAKARQSLDPVFLIQQTPGPDRIIVH